MNEQNLVSGLKLARDAGGLFLTDGELVLRADFTHMIPRIREANLRNELLVKAARRPAEGEKRLAVDAAAGFGEDAILLAAAGYAVRLYERDPVIAALLADALSRAEKIPGLQEAVSRMTLLKEDSIPAMREMKESPDVIFLDPMFPERTKSALVKKKFPLLKKLEQPCPDEEELLDASRKANPRRIVVKRPLKGPYLANVKPDFSLAGKAIRYDCLIIRNS